MNILLTADWHLTDNPRDHYRHEWQKDLRRMVKKNKVDLVIILGDLCEEKDRHSAWLVNKVVEHLDRLSRLCDVIILRGNHDYLNPDNPFWAFVSRLEGVAWVNLPTEGKSLPSKALEDLGRSVFLPHTSEPEKEWAELDFKDYDWVFAHNTFEGAVGEHGHKLKGPSTSIFHSKNRIISGDVHVPQTIGHLVYVGAPYTVDFGDDYDPRCLLVKDGRVKELACTGPQKVLLEASLLDGFVELQDIAEEKGVIPGDVIKVRIYLLKDQFAEWPYISKVVRDWGKAQGHHIYSVQPVVEKDTSTKADKRKDDNPRLTDQQLLDEYVKRMGVDKKTAKVGEGLLREA